MTTNYNKFPDYINATSIIELFSQTQDEKLFRVRKLITNAVNDSINSWIEGGSYSYGVCVDISQYQLTYDQLKIINTELIDRGFELIYKCYIGYEYYNSERIYQYLSFKDLNDPLKYHVETISIVIPNYEPKKYSAITTRYNYNI